MRDSLYTVGILLTACGLIGFALTLTWFEINEYKYGVSEPDYTAPAGAGGGASEPVSPSPTSETGEAGETPAAPAAEGEAPGSASPADVVLRYNDAAQAGEWESVVQLTAEGERQEVEQALDQEGQGRQMFVDMMRSMTAVNINIEGEQVDGGQATVRVSATVEGEKKNVTVTLVNEDGWKIKEWQAEMPRPE